MQDDAAKLISCSCRRGKTVSKISSVELMVEELDLEVPHVAAIVVDAQAVLDQQLRKLYTDPHSQLGRRATLSLVVCSGAFLRELEDEWRGGFGIDGDEEEQEDDDIDEPEDGSVGGGGEEAVEFLAFPQERGGGGSLLGDVIVSYDAALDVAAVTRVSNGHALHGLLFKGVCSLLGQEVQTEVPAGVLSNLDISFPTTASFLRRRQAEPVAQLPLFSDEEEEQGVHDEEEAAEEEEEEMESEEEEESVSMRSGGEGEGERARVPEGPRAWRESDDAIWGELEEVRRCLEEDGAEEEEEETESGQGEEEEGGGGVAEGEGGPGWAEGAKRKE